MNLTIKAIIFDSGKVLNYPKTGNWFIPPNFFEIVEKEIYKSISKKKVDMAFKRASEYINSVKLIESIEAEYFYFLEFYRIFSDNLQELNLSEHQIEELTKDLVYNSEKYLFYGDALKILDIMKEKYKLAIVSDGWISVKNVYKKNGLLEYFDSIVISTLIGTSKPDARMYQKALDDLNVLPSEAIFVDDNLSNCIGAQEVGIQSYCICRERFYYAWMKMKCIGKQCKVIHTLDDLIKALN